MNDCIVDQSARLYHKFDNARGSKYARIGSGELDSEETRDEHVEVSIMPNLGRYCEGASSGVHDY